MNLISCSLIIFAVSFLSCAPAISSRTPPSRTDTPSAIIQPKGDLQTEKEYQKDERQNIVDEKSIVKKLERLKEMRDRGLITEEEYQGKKKEILKSM